MKGLSEKIYGWGLCGCWMGLFAKQELLYGLRGSWKYLFTEHLGWRDSEVLECSSYSRQVSQDCGLEGAPWKNTSHCSLPSELDILTLCISKCEVPVGIRGTREKMV